MYLRLIMFITGCSVFVASRIDSNHENIFFILMKCKLKYILHLILSAILFTGCINYKKAITDEIVLRDGNSQTGTIIQCDSTKLKVRKIDESISIIPWSIIDSVKGKKLKTLWLGANTGYYNVPYFSVFRNESFVGKNLGMQYKIGLALRGNKLYYVNLSYLPAKPYDITKFGLGYQRYLSNKNYLQNNCLFVGSELNLMSVKLNNSAQVTLEPFTGFEKKINEQMRLHFKLGLQINIANRNNQVGVNTTIGIHFLKRNFKKYYDVLNKEHRIIRK